MPVMSSVSPGSAALAAVCRFVYCPGEFGLLSTVRCAAFNPMLNENERTNAEIEWRDRVMTVRFLSDLSKVVASAIQSKAVENSRSSGWVLGS